MDLIVNANVLRHLSHLFDRGRSAEPFVPHTITKPLCPYRAEVLQPFPRRLPEELGLSSRDLTAFLKEVAAHPELEIHGISVFRKGALLMNADFGAYSSSYWHAWHSLSKSVTATAVGMLIDEGKLSLDDKAVRILEKKIPALAQLTHKAITVRHLLTMTAGPTFSEAGILVEKHWLRAYFESSLRFEPGKQFYYNSLNSYVLAAIVKEITGQGLCEYLKPRLFDPLGISVYHWETSPEGLENAGWGLYLRREDAAKIGQLYLNGGLWKEKQLLSEEWVREATARHVSTPAGTGIFDYGLHMWSGRHTSCFLFNGMFGQDLLAFPESGMMIVTNGGLEQIFQQSVYYDILMKYFGRDLPDSLPRDRRGERELTKATGALKAKEAKATKPKPFFTKPFPSFLNNALGVEYLADKQRDSDIIHTTSVTGTANQSLLPCIEQVLRNRYAKGIDSFTLVAEERYLSLRVREEKTIYVLPIVLGKTVRTVLRLSDTDYHAAVAAEAAYDEEGRGVLKLRLSFPEISSSRHIKIFFEGQSIEVEMNEMPGMGLIDYAVTSLEDALRSKKRLADMVSKFDPDLLYCKLEKT
ncbi:MAG: serine hydrolase, partial [Clostridia bacterium]|nr:serine hydrolase [Clostridia bacterium]